MAIKCISFKNAPKEFVTKFLPRELNIVSCLAHKHIVHVYEVLEVQLLFCISLEFLHIQCLAWFLVQRLLVAEC